MKKKTVVYVAGPITGTQNYRERFLAVKRKLESVGYGVLNPAEMPDGMTPAQYMRVCFAMIDVSDAVLFQTGSENSAGAALELAYCRYIGKPYTQEGPDGRIDMYALSSANGENLVEKRQGKRNYDRVQNMSIEELAEFIYSAGDKICFENCTKQTGNKFSCKFGENVDSSNCIKCMKQWLEKEVEDDG